MWQMIAGTGLRCSECRHTIQPGRLCLSELPEETPPGVSRADFKNYCIGCPQCWAQGKHACYVRHLENDRSIGKVPRSLPCAHCGRRIGAGEKASVDIYYEWPEGTEGRTLSATSLIGTATAAARVDTLIRGVPNGSFENLTDKLQLKLKYAGLGGDWGTRTRAEAQGFYQDSVPHPIRNLGEKSVWQFLDEKEASHIQSKHNTPHLARENSNIIWENEGLNNARRSADMTPGEQFRAGVTNARDTATIVFRDCLQAGAMAALYAGLFEAPVAAVENYIYYRRGLKSGEEAIWDASKSIAGRAAGGFVIGFAVTGAVALLGAGPLLVTIAPILLPIGLALYGLTALKRILNALHAGLPLHQVGTYFCSPRCHTRFAYETGHSALLRWEETRVTVATA